MPPGHFFAFVSRGDGQGHAQVYAWTIRQSLPAIPIPLKAPDPPIWVDLGAIFATTYERARYARTSPSPYDQPLDASLSEADRKWVRERVEAMRSS